jgi:hypothetical protein
MHQFIISIILCLQVVAAMAQSPFQRQLVTKGNLHLSITNAGTIGDPSMAGNSPLASMQYPANSGKEHLFESGIWLGAVVNNQTLVSTAAIDAASGYVQGNEGFEFTSNLGNSIKERSTLANDNFYSSSAISHQDFVLDITDKNIVIPGTQTTISNHTDPLGADIHLETYAWNYGYADFFVILNYTITNNSTNTWDSVFVGNWSDLVVRNVNVTTASGTAFFNKGGHGWLDTVKAIYAYDYNGDVGYTNSYGAMVFLGSEWRNHFMHPDNDVLLTSNGIASPKVNANFWRYKDINPLPGLTYYPGNDIERYNRMTIGSNPLHTNLFLNSAENRIQLLSVGPYKQIAPGEKFTYTIAMVAAKQDGPASPHTIDDFANRKTLLNNINWALRTYKGEDVNNNGILDATEDLDADNKLDRFILPSPPNDPHVKIITHSDSIEIFWDKYAESTIDPISKVKDFEGYKLYRSFIANNSTSLQNNEPSLIAQWDKINDSIGFNNGFKNIQLNKPKRFDGDTTNYHYRYSMHGLLNGWKYQIILTAFDQGDKSLALDPLESSFIVNTFEVFPGTTADNDDTAQIGVYPNPYSISAAWDGGTATSKKINFYNLPLYCIITIYNLSGEVITKFEHNGTTNDGSDIDWYKLLGGTAANRILPGGEHSYDLLSNSKQSLTQGLYLYTVKNNVSGHVTKGTFGIIK